MGRAAGEDFVLLVDDDPNALAIAATALGAAGVATRLASSFGEALEQLPRGPSAIVLDVLMPHDDSTRVVEWLAQHAPRTPVIVVSALPSRDLTALAREWRDAGVRVTGTLQKGYGPEELLAAVAGRTSADGASRATPAVPLDRRRSYMH